MIIHFVNNKTFQEYQILHLSFIKIILTNFYFIIMNRKRTKSTILLLISIRIIKNVN